MQYQAMVEVAEHALGHADRMLDREEATHADLTEAHQLAVLSVIALNLIDLNRTVEMVSQRGLRTC